MKKRKKMSFKKSKRDFKKKAGIHKKNILKDFGTSRGGIRL